MTVLVYKVKKGVGESIDSKSKEKEEFG